MRPSRAALLMISPQIPVPIWLKNEASRPMQPSVSTTRSNMFLLFSNDVEKLSEKGTSNAPTVKLAGMRRAKSAKRELLGSPQGYATSTSKPFRTVSEGEFSEVPQLTLFPEAYTSSSERSMLQTLRGTKSRRVKAQDRYPPSS